MKPPIIVKVQDGISFGDHLSGTVTSKEKVVGYSESHGRGRAAHASIDVEGNVTHGIEGKPSLGEEGTAEVARRFVEAKNNQQVRWHPPTIASSEHTDARSEPIYTGENALKIQVVRAISETSHWKMLGKTGAVQVQVESALNVAQLLCDSIALKKEKIPAETRASMSLVLNGVDAPVTCLDAVIEAFRTEHGDYAAGAGFKEIWLVGPQSNMVTQIA